MTLRCPSDLYMTLHESSQSCSTFEDYKGLLEQPAEPKFKALLPPLWTSGLGPGGAGSSSKISFCRMGIDVWLESLPFRVIGVALAALKTLKH